MTRERVSQETIVWFMEQVSELLQQGQDASSSSIPSVLMNILQATGYPSKSEVTHEDDHILIILTPETLGATIFAIGCLAERAKFSNIIVTNFTGLFGVWTGIQCCCHEAKEHGHDLTPDAETHVDGGSISPESAQAGEDVAEFLRKWRNSKH